MIHRYTIKRGVIPGLLLFFTSLLSAQLDLPRGSQAATVSQRVGISDITISYSRPAVAEREIWGGLVPYGMNNLGFGTAEESPWRAGANENTVVSLEHDALVEGQPLPAGSYGLHLIVYPDDRATVIFSKSHHAWGSFFYDPEDDALRVEISAREAPHTEWLTYGFTDLSPVSALVCLRWEKKEFPFKVEFDTPAIVLADIRQRLQNQEGFNRQSWEQAAAYALNNGGDLDEAIGWIDAAIAGQFFSQKNFNNLSTKAQILEAQGKNNEAEALMKEALDLGTSLEIHGYGRQLIAQGKPAKALEVFLLNARKHKNTWPVDLGLARGYSANGDFKKAIKHLKLAHGRAPDPLNRQAIESNLIKLEQGQDIN